MSASDPSSSAAPVVCPRCGHAPADHNCWDTSGVVTCRKCPRPRPRLTRRGWDPRDKRCRISIRKMDALAIKAEARNV